MNFFRGDQEPEKHGVDVDKGKAHVHLGIGMGPISIRLDAFESLQTLHEQTDIASLKEKDLEQPEEKEISLNAKYAKWAGEPPDGGLKAWSVIVATCMTSCAALGYVTAWGVFQSYYATAQLSHLSPSTIAWIGSVQYALIFFPGLVTGRLFDIGFFRIPFTFASILLVICTFLTAECKEYYQFFLAQGLGIGIASGLLFGPSLGIVSHWFKKRRGLALGVTAIGSSLGGIIFPVAAQNLIPQVGFKWTMRIFGFMLIFILAIANLLIDRRLPPVKAKGSVFNLDALKNPAYAIYCVSGTLSFLGMYTVLTYMPVSSLSDGVSSNFSFYYIAIINASSAVARLVSGSLGDRFGALNVMIPFTVLAAFMTFAWPFVTTKGGLIGIAIVYGFGYGTFISLLPVPAVSMGPIEDVGRRMGLFLSFAAIGALGGPPISGAINSATGGFHAVGWWGGAILLFSVILLILVRYLHLRQWQGKF